MTKRHYIQIAQILKTERDVQAVYGDADIRHAAIAAVDDVSRQIADFCGRDNPRFDRARFLTACGVAS